jgi:hypothetical protein
LSHQKNEHIASLPATNCYISGIRTKRYQEDYFINSFIMKKVRTFPLTDVPIGSGLTVTVPFKASSRTLAEMVVLIGTPSLLLPNKVSNNVELNNF